MCASYSLFFICTYFLFHTACIFRTPYFFFSLHYPAYNYTYIYLFFFFLFTVRFALTSPIGYLTRQPRFISSTKVSSRCLVCINLARKLDNLTRTSKPEKLDPCVQFSVQLVTLHDRPPGLVSNHSRSESSKKRWRNRDQGGRRWRKGRLAAPATADRLS